MAELGKNGAVIKRSIGPWGFNNVIEKNGEKYMSRSWIGRLRLHIFYKGDDDRDPHDHPWSFWTFPFTDYVEEVTLRSHDGFDPIYVTRMQIVRAWRWNYRPAEHCHRVIGPWKGRVRIIEHPTFEMIRPRHDWLVDHPQYEPVAEPFNGGKLITLVWRTDFTRMWGFLKTRDGKWCWQDFKTYLREGGVNAPCGDE